MYRTTFGADGASVCMDVDECDTKPCWQVWSLAQITFGKPHACLCSAVRSAQSGSAAAACLNTPGSYSCGSCPEGFKQELGIDQGHGCIPVGGGH